MTKNQNGQQTTALAHPAGLKATLQRADVQERFQDILDDNAPEFLASLLSVVNAENKLRACTHASILTAAAKAAVLRLPIERSLGFAWIVPFKDKATFILGYKGMVQLAIRTARYDTIHADVLLEGEEAIEDRATGKWTFSGEPISDKVIGAFATFVELPPKGKAHGYSKTIYWPIERILNHAIKYSPSYRESGPVKGSAWATAPNEMYKKTVLRQLLSKWARFSIRYMDDDDTEVLDDQKLAKPQEAVDFAEIVDPTARDVETEPEPDPEVLSDVELQEEWLEEAVELKLVAHINHARNRIKHSSLSFKKREQVTAWFRRYEAWKSVHNSWKVEVLAERADSGELPNGG